MGNHGVFKCKRGGFGTSDLNVMCASIVVAPLARFFAGWAAFCVFTTIYGGCPWFFTRNFQVRLDALSDITYDTSMNAMRVVIDTNILYAGLYSSSGASFQLLRLIRAGQVKPCISVTLAMEYEAVLFTRLEELDLTKEQLQGFLGFFVAQAERVKVFYLWRPGLRDPGDDMVLETAVAARADYLITHNVKDFTGADRFGIRVVTPGWFVQYLGGTL